MKLLKLTKSVAILIIFYLLLSLLFQVLVLIIRFSWGYHALMSLLTLMINSWIVYVIYNELDD